MYSGNEPVGSISSYLYAVTLPSTVRPSYRPDVLPWQRTGSVRTWQEDNRRSQVVHKCASARNCAPSCRYHDLLPEKEGIAVAWRLFSFRTRVVLHTSAYEACVVLRAEINVHD